MSKVCNKKGRWSFWWYVEMEGMEVGSSDKYTDKDVDNRSGKEPFQTMKIKPTAIRVKVGLFEQKSA